MNGVPLISHRLFVAALEPAARPPAKIGPEDPPVESGGALSHLHSAERGVLQITPLPAVQTSWDEMNGTSSREKTITAAVTATFALK